MVWLAACESRRWQLNREARAAAVPRLVMDSAIIHIQQAGRQKESQAQPVPAHALRDKRLKQVSSNALRHTWTVVFDLDDNLCAGCPIWLQPHPDGRVLSLLQRFERVVEQSADNLTDHVFGDIHAPRVDVPEHVVGE